MRIVICAFNEAQLLPTCLGRIPKGSKVTIIDGAYTDYPHDVPWSTDGTCELAERWGADIVRVTEPWVDQIAKRSFSLTLAKTVFVLDADEMLLTSIPSAIASDVGWVSIVSSLYDEVYPEPRIFRVQDGWHYEGRHHWIFDGDNNLVASHRARGDEYVHSQTRTKILNARHWRNPLRRQEKSAYAASRNRKEGEIDGEHSIGSGIIPLRDLPCPNG